jgi:branched-chain amino acid transport system substrate-binding protein
MNRFMKGLIGMALGLGFALAMAMPAMAADVVEIGVVSTFSGAYAALGDHALKGSKYAVEEFKGKILGKPMEAYAIEDEAKPGVGARKVREAIESKGVKFFHGAVSSAVGLAVSQVVNEKQAVYLTSVGADEITGKACNRYTFRWSVPTYGAVQETVVPLIKKFPDAKRWYTVTPDYVFGHSLLNNAVEVFKKYGVEHVGNDMHPIGHTEFSSFYTKAMASKADFVVFFNFGKDTINALKQADNFGLKKKAKILVAWSSGLMDLQEMGPETAEGVYFGCQFWHDVDVPVTRALTKGYLAKYNEIISYPAASSYIMTRLLVLGIEKAKSLDPTVVAKGIEKMEWDGLTGKESMQAFDHQTNKRYYLLVAKEKKDIKGPGDLASVLSSGRSFKPQSESDCHMK